MKRTSVAVAALGLLVVLSPVGTAQGVAARHLPHTSCSVFPADNYWHADVSKLPVHPRSRQWLAHMSSDRDLHPDFGPSYGDQPVPYGIPYTVVGPSHRRVHVSFQYGDE